MTTTWQILDTKRQKATGVITRVTYQCTAQEGDKIYKKTGNVPLTGSSPSLPGFIPFTDLTEEIIVNWVKSALGADILTTIEVNLTHKITQDKSNSGLPW